MMSSLRRGRAGELPESPKKHRNVSNTQREGERERQRGEREVEVRRPKHGNKSTIQVFGAALTGGRMGWGLGGRGDWRRRTGASERPHYQEASYALNAL